METWNIVKLINSGLGVKIKLEVMKFDASPGIDESLFTQDIPKNVEITNMDGHIMEEEIVAIEELTEEMGKPLLYVPESLGYELRQIRLYKFNNDDLDDEATQEYFKDGIKNSTYLLLNKKLMCLKENLLEIQRYEKEYIQISTIALNI